MNVGHKDTSLQELSSKQNTVLRLLIEHAGPSGKVEYRALREAKFPEKLAAVLRTSCQYLDSLASREFQALQNKGWVKLDRTGTITVLHRPP